MDIERVAEARRRGVRLVMGPPPTFCGPASAIECLKRSPEMARVVLARAAAFRRQLEGWAMAGRFGVPVLALPDAPPAALDRCISCGVVATPAHWRCAVCLEALELALEEPR
jgi:hypothetical protein